jgi:hypothetical protein
MNGGANRDSPSELTRGRRLLVLGICSMSLLIVGLDVTIFNVALPAIPLVFRCLIVRAAMGS